MDPTNSFELVIALLCCAQRASKRNLARGAWFGVHPRANSVAVLPRPVLTRMFQLLHWYRCRSLFFEARTLCPSQGISGAVVGHDEHEVGQHQGVCENG